MTPALPKSRNAAKREALTFFALSIGKVAPSMTMGELSAILLAARMLAVHPEEATQVLRRVREACEPHGLLPIWTEDDTTLRLWSDTAKEAFSVPCY